MHLGGRQKLATYAAGVALMGGVGFVGAQWARPAAPLKIEAVSETPPAIGEGPSKVETAIEEPSPKEVVVALAGR